MSVLLGDARNACNSIFGLSIRSSELKRGEVASPPATRINFHNSKEHYYPRLVDDVKDMRPSVKIPRQLFIVGSHPELRERGLLTPPTMWYDLGPEQEAEDHTMNWNSLADIATSVGVLIATGTAVVYIVKFLAGLSWKVDKLSEDVKNLTRTVEKTLDIVVNLSGRVSRLEGRADEQARNISDLSGDKDESKD